MVWGSTLESEEKIKDEFEEYIKNELYGKNVVERKFIDNFQLEDNSELYIFGIDHLKTLGWYWRFQIFTLDNKLIYTHTSDECNSKFYTIKLTGGIKKGFMTIDSSNFRFQEMVWTKRKILNPKVYLVE